MFSVRLPAARATRPALFESLPIGKRPRCLRCIEIVSGIVVVERLEAALSPREPYTGRTTSTFEIRILAAPAPIGVARCSLGCGQTTSDLVRRF